MSVAAGHAHTYHTRNSLDMKGAFFGSRPSYGMKEQAWLIHRKVLDEWRWVVRDATGVWDIKLKIEAARCYTSVRIAIPDIAVSRSCKGYANRQRETQPTYQAETPAARQ